MSKLYLEHFGLDRPPFRLTPDLEFFYAGSRRGDVLEGLLHVASHEEGIVTVVAEVGSGKTLLARVLLARLASGIDTVFLANPCFSRDEILSAIARDLGIAHPAASLEGKLAQLNAELLRRHDSGRRVLLVVDEAHAMPAESLEEVRLLSNLETSEHKLLNILLFGQPELDQLLAESRLRQVRDRIIHRFELPPLPEDDILAYVDHRLRTAGWKRGKLFSRAAQAILVRESGGRVRRINLLADKALLAAFADNSPTVEKQHVQTAAADLQPDLVAASRPARPPGPPGKAGWPTARSATLAGTALALGIGLGWWLSRAPANPLPTAAPAPAVQAPVATPTAPRVDPPETPAPQPAAAPAAAHRSLPSFKSERVEQIFRETQDKLTGNALSGYTVQLAALPADGDPSHYFQFLSQYIDLSHILAHTRTYSGKRYWAVYYGEYETEKQAQASLAALPEILKARHPMLRTWAKIRQEPEL